MKKVLSFLAIAAMIVACGEKDPQPGNDPGNKDPQGEEVPQGGEEEPQQPEEPQVAITIDGDFADWANVDESVGAAVGKNNADSPWPGVKEIRCYANADFVFYYIKFDQASLKEALEEMETPEMHIRLCINTDGEFESGYGNYFLEAYDFIIEGCIAEEGAFVDYGGTLHQRLDSWTELADPASGIVNGKGNGNEYEIMLLREIFNNAVAGSPSPNSPMGDVFHTGIRFYYNGWDEFSNMPNSSVDDVENGWGHMLEVTTMK